MSMSIKRRYRKCARITNGEEYAGAIQVKKTELQKKKNNSQKKTVKTFPLPEDFNLTADEINKIKQIQSSPYESNVNWAQGCLLYFLFPILMFAFVSFFKIGTTKHNPTPLLIVSVILVIVLIKLEMIKRSRRDHVKRQYSEKFKNYKSYSHAIIEYEYLQEKFWFSLSGYAFEFQLAHLYKQSGFETQQTRASGDGGIDIVMYKDNKKYIVQCKQHKKPIGPAIVRELYGVLISEKADVAILACTGGFTKGVYEFALNKPIQLIDIKDILKMKKLVFDEKE